MAIITISRGSYSKGKEIAEKVAERLNYDCISRDILLEASQHYNVPEIKLVRAIHDAPTVLDRFGYNKERYMAYIQCAFLEHAQKDNMVYHGLAGQFLIAGVSHVLKIRIIAEIEDRVRLEVERENIPEETALKTIRKDDDERRKWALTLWGKDCWDPSLYDLIIHVHRLTTENAIDLICDSVAGEQFKTTAESQAKVEDSLLAARVKTKLVDHLPGCKVGAKDGSVFVNVQEEISREAKIKEEIMALTHGTPGVQEVKVHISPAVI